MCSLFSAQAHKICFDKVYLMFLCTEFLHRVVRLSSGKLNYLIIIGATFMYFSVYFYVLPTTAINIMEVACVVCYVTYIECFYAVT